MNIFFLRASYFTYLFLKFYFIYIYFWLHWILLHGDSFSSCGENSCGYSLIVVASLVLEHEALAWASQLRSCQFLQRKISLTHTLG